MTELQTTVEFSVELYKFYNVDLFQRGYYQIRTSFRMSPRYTSKIEVSLSNGHSERTNITSSQIVFPSCVVTGTAVSKTFQILYRNEEVILDDVILFRVHLIVDSRKIEDSLLKADFQLMVELWFTEQPFGPDHHNSIQCVSARSMKLHLCPLKGIHHHLPVLFDYFHLSAVTLTVHGCLLAIHQPYMNVSKPGKPAWLTNSPKVGNRFQSSASLESVLFGNVQGMKSSPSLIRLNQARCIHQSICTILLSSHESLQSKLFEYMKLLPPWQQLQIEVTDCCAKLRKLKGLSKNVEAEDELLAVVNSDIAQLCAENIILWQQFLECFTLKDRIQQHLTREHHVQRVKRFAEGFFVVENARQAIFHCAEQSYQTYLSISDSIRKTKYFSSLPSLAVECPDLDGNAETLPVIFEDHYQDIAHSRKDSSKRTPSAISVHDIGFDLTSNEEAAATAAAIQKLATNSDTDVCSSKMPDNKSSSGKSKRHEDAKQTKTVGCFSTVIMPKSSMSSEDLYYVDNDHRGRKKSSSKDINCQTYKRKVASLPRGCVSVEDKMTSKNESSTPHQNVSCGPCKTSLSVEHISPFFRETSVDRFGGFDGRYFRITSSAAVPKYVQAKRKEAFRASGGSKSLSAVEESSNVRTLPKYPYRSIGGPAGVMIPRLETVPLFSQILSAAEMDMDTRLSYSSSCRRQQLSLLQQQQQPRSASLATSNSMDLAGVIPSKSSLNGAAGGSVVCGHWTQRSNQQWVSHVKISNKIPNKPPANTTVILGSDRKKVLSNHISASSSSSFSTTKDNSSDVTKKPGFTNVVATKNPPLVQNDQAVKAPNKVETVKPVINDATTPNQTQTNVPPKIAISNDVLKPEITPTSGTQTKPDETTNDVNYIKQRLKETLKLELNASTSTSSSFVPVRKTYHYQQNQKDDVVRRVGNKIRRKRFIAGAGNASRGLKVMQSLRNHSTSACSTSSDSIIVLTGYKKLEQSESLPVGLTHIGSSVPEAKQQQQQTKDKVDDEDEELQEHILEEDTDDELLVQDLDFECPGAAAGSRQQQLRKTKVTRSMPNVAIFASVAATSASSSSFLKKDASIVTSGSMPDLGSETTTEVDDLSSVSLAARKNNGPSSDIIGGLVDSNTHWFYRDCSGMTKSSLLALPKVIVKDSTTEAEEDDEDVLVTPKVELGPMEPDLEVERDKQGSSTKGKSKKRRTPVRNVETKKMAWLRQRTRGSSSSTCSSSSGSSTSSTSERSGWVSSQCSSLDASTSSDVGRDPSPAHRPSKFKEAAPDALEVNKTPTTKATSIRTAKVKRRRGREVKKVPAGGAKSTVAATTASPSLTCEEDSKHIYEEIHLPPEEFRDPTPTHTSAIVLQPPSPFTNANRSQKTSRSKTGDHVQEQKQQGRGQHRSIKQGENKSLDVPTVHRSRPRPHLARSHAIRHQQNLYKDRLEAQQSASEVAAPVVDKQPRDRSDSSSATKRYREPVTAEYLDTKCTILEMFTDSTFCGYAGNGNNWPSPTPENGDGKRGTLADRVDEYDDVTDDDTDELDDHERVPAAPPPPRTRTPSVPNVEMTSSTTATCTEEELNGRPDDTTSTSPCTLVSVVGDNTINFVKAKEDFKKQLSLSAFIYSDYPLLASTIPYFHVSEDFRLNCTDGLHLVVCVHGLDGNSADLRLVKTYLELGLPCSNLEFLMSERNQGDTFSDFEKMTDKLVAEILYHIEAYRLSPAKISFIGHSLGNIIIRSALARPQMKPWLAQMHTFLSLSGPHLGTLYNSSGLVNMGLWFMQKWKKSGSLLQLSMKDATDIRRTFLYRLSQKPGLEHFKNILLFGSSQDRYVPIHSARIELCKASLRDTSVQGMAYRDMVHGLLQPVARNPNITFVRYDVHHALPNTANSLIGRAAHIAVLDSELFIEKFLTVCGLKYFK